MSDDIDAINSAGHDDGKPPGWRLTRRAFLAGCAAVAGTAAVAGKIVDDTFLGGLQPAEAAAPVVPQQLVRTGHSNNCDGACGHLVHVADGKVKLIEGGPYDTTTIDGTAIPRPTRRASACAVCRSSRTSTAATASSIRTSGSALAARVSGSGSAGTRRRR